MSERDVVDILAIPGSLRKDSFNRLLLLATAECAPPGMQIRLYEELKHVPLFNEDLETPEHNLPKPVLQLHKAVADADGLLLATPEYNQSLPGVLKNALDWLSRPLPDEVLVGKPVAIMGATPGRWGTRLAQTQLRHVLYATESLVMQTPGISIAGASNLFDSDGHLVTPDTRAALAKFTQSFSDWIAQIQRGLQTDESMIPVQAVLK